MAEDNEQKELAAAVGRIPSGLFVVTATREGKATGMLGSWIQQCSFDPPQITIAIRNDRDLLRWLEEGAAFTVNILDAGQTDMIAHFGRGFALDQDAFQGLDILRLEGTGPVLSESLAYLVCRVTGRLAAADHCLLIARVDAGKVLGTGQPMVHIRKSGMHY